METTNYQGNAGVVDWQGTTITKCPEFDDFMQNDVASRLHDQQGNDDFVNHLRGLATTGFAQNSLAAILAAQMPEERDWAVGEAFAEAWLSKNHGVIWPWNLERDKRTPKASLPGADLIGFININTELRLLIGEVKTSSDSNSPPNVMYGRDGMIHQLESLVSNLSLIAQLLRWLQPRCKNTAYENQFNAAIGLLLKTGNKAFAAFGILIRDTAPNERDLQKRGEALAEKVQVPTSCRLQAFYLPYPIADLPSLVSSGAVS